MRKYEYCFIEGVDPSDSRVECQEIVLSNGKKKSVRERLLFDVLNFLGNEGWEMVGCGGSTGDGARYDIYFKRELG